MEAERAEEVAVLLDVMSELISLYFSANNNLILVFSIKFFVFKVEIFSVLGTKVFEKTVHEDQIIPISFQAGMYFVKINTNDKQIIKKIIVK